MSLAQANTCQIVLPKNIPESKISEYPPPPPSAIELKELRRGLYILKTLA